jgi:hypothetical protein
MVRRIQMPQLQTACFSLLDPSAFIVRVFMEKIGAYDKIIWVVWVEFEAAWWLVEDLCGEGMYILSGRHGGVDYSIDELSTDFKCFLTRMTLFQISLSSV